MSSTKYLNIQFCCLYYIIYFMKSVYFLDLITNSKITETLKKSKQYNEKIQIATRLTIFTQSCTLYGVLPERFGI